MPACTVCTHPQREAINAQLQEGVSLRTLARTYDLVSTSLHRHKHHHLQLQGLSDLELTPGQESADLVAHLQEVHNLLIRRLQEQTDSRPFLATTRQLHANARLLADLLGLYPHRPLRQPAQPAAQPAAPPARQPRLIVLPPGIPDDADVDALIAAGIAYSSDPADRPQLTSEPEAAAAAPAEYARCGIPLSQPASPSADPAAASRQAAPPATPTPPPSQTPTLTGVFPCEPTGRTPAELVPQVIHVPPVFFPRFGPPLDLTAPETNEGAEAPEAAPPADPESSDPPTPPDPQTPTPPARHPTFAPVWKDYEKLARLARYGPRFF